jgi:short-subunit dehydrogenase
MHNDTGILGKTALITGASSGIGYELTKLFARDGLNLVLVARDQTRLAQIGEELHRSFNVSATIIPKDLAQARAADELFHELQRTGVEVDILVNNAGFNVYGPFAETDAQQELQMLQLHVVTLTQLTKLVLPGMIKRQFGKILNMGSTGSFAPGPYDAVYCASKAYVLSFSEALAEELRGTGVTITTVCPGATKTAFAQRAGMSDTKLFQGRLLSAAKVAQTGYRALLHGRTSVVVGRANKLMTFALRLTPRNLVARMSKRILSRTASRSAAAVHQGH